MNPLAQLREHDPANETPIGPFRPTRYDDVVRMLKEPPGVRMADGSIFDGVPIAGRDAPPAGP